MIEKFDNFIEEHIAQLIDMQIREVSWKFDYDSVKNGVNKHWHVFCGHTEEELKATLKSKINPECPALANPNYVPYQ